MKRTRAVLQQADVLHRSSFRTPLGSMVAISSSKGLAALLFPDTLSVPRFEPRMRRWFTACPIVETISPFARAAERWLEDYFGPERRRDLETDVRLDLRGTRFERAVWAELLKIPAGATTTYSELARRVGSAHAARAVGAAVGQNSITILVPCHRVVGTNGSLTGYGGGLERKRWLLCHESQFQLA